MSKITFASLKLKPNDEVKTFVINDKTIEVKQYLPTEDKINILDIVMQQADQATVMNTLALDVLFHLYIVYKYTNISFTDKQKEDPFALYDILDQNDIINAVVSTIPEDEYKFLRDGLVEMTKEYMQYRNSARAVVEQFKMFAPSEAADISEKIANLDVDKMAKIFQLADATGMALDK